MKKWVRRLSGLVLFFALFAQTFAPVGSNFATTEVLASSSQYGLPSKTDEGVIFHAWNWSFDAIRSKLPEIAAAGYKSIQTSPIQGTKENSMVGSQWWVLYQPINFNIGNAQLGSRDQFRQLCEAAEQYGIHIIVDVVANHTGNAGGGTLQYTPAYNVDPSIRNNSSFWNEARGVENWNDRWQVTQWGIGLPDLKTSNQELQNKIIAFLNDAVSLGADGFRFDAAKHIELPTDQYGASNFWTRVLGSLNNANQLYIYGEVLQGGADAFAQYANYMDVTASYYGDNVRHAVGHHSTRNVNTAKDYNAAGVNPSKLVTWVESHDTYANDSSESTYMSEWQIKMGWAIIASRAQTVSLFFNRPAGSGKFASSLGAAGNDLWKDADVVAVNKFHNAMVGQGEYLRNQGNDILLVERGNKGVTIVNLGPDASIDQPSNLASGTYSNKATGGGTFTVSNGRITGNIRGGSIAVLYEETTAPVSPTIAINHAEGAFYSESLPIMITLTNATSGTYRINNGNAESFNSGQTVTIGQGAAYGTSFTLHITANGANSSTSQSYTFVKQEPGAAYVVNFYKPEGWGTPNLYYYDDSVTPIASGPAWPGAAMTDEGNGWYSYSISGMNSAKVIFNSNNQQIPGAQQPGYTVNGSVWIKDGIVSTTPPADPDPLPEQPGMVNVTFNIQQATTYMGQNVYIVGNIAELGSWNPANAIGPGSTTNYPTWSITVALPAGTAIEYKAIKKDGGKVVWESGSNRTYTVSASNPTVSFNFK